MDSRKNTYFIKLIKSYSVLLIIILVLGIVFHLILSNNAKKELLNENLTSLQKVTEQFSDCYSNMYLIAKRLAGNSSLAHLAESAPGERAFYYNAYLAKQDLVDMYSDYPLSRFRHIMSICISQITLFVIMILKNSILFINIA